VQHVRIVEADPQGADALGLLREAAVEARALYPELFEPDAPWPTNLPTPQGGVYVVAYEGERPVACGAIRPLEGSTAEVRRMFVTRAARRQGLARAVLCELKEQAIRLGYVKLRLETGYKQVAAITLYQTEGFKRIEPFGEYAGDPTSVCFEKALRVESDA
jgi:putative acetyltransferase